ncbi:transcriptional regulator, AraC family [Poseidonocella pacifica]|uniref:Transcriptional regulator, AraC family n=1 Tax=Poseidonocella pacifica TaxID=871651 RepID=A0A1I0XJ38_9RHOB|nr:helix-turn-helix transcriptional regulator [Poseidonocella pacifica]SFB01045.1 transcriptional regulator, AraC family [Poseidonocella pacifica]
MDKIEHHALGHIPMRSLSLRLARSTIRMSHGASWRINKVNPVHDLIICLSGSGVYQVGEDAERIELRPGEAMLIPAYTRFRGNHGGGSELFTGIAQHFTLDLFERGDLIQQMALRRAVGLPNWGALEPLLRHYRDASPHGSTTLVQHHQFMVVLLAFLETAFVEWRVDGAEPDSQDHLSVQIMLAAARLSADPLGSGAGADEVLERIPYNPDYFRRAFKERIGYTPQKFRELKRMEFAANRLGMGLSVKAAAEELGYSDPYFFSRMFKRYLGANPSSYRERKGRKAATSPRRSATG